jgi:predicted 3-demethylubiquinone-9 3-methyltransferase (glyoxalase superfamily)
MNAVTECASLLRDEPHLRYTLAMASVQKITPFLTYDGTAEEAANFYVSLFPDAKVQHVQPGPGGKALVVRFELAGQSFLALNAGGPDFAFTHGVSLLVDCTDQAEVDHFWNALVADGGKELACGWCEDRFGLAWQIVPKQFFELLSGGDGAQSGRVMGAMMKMRKFVIADLEAAAKG